MLVYVELSRRFLKGGPYVDRYKYAKHFLHSLAQRKFLLVHINNDERRGEVLKWDVSYCVVISGGLFGYIKL